MAVPTFTKMVEVDEDYDGNPATTTCVMVDVDGDSVSDVCYQYDGDIDPEDKRVAIEADLIVRGYSWTV